MPATLGQVIRERRMELDLTQEELAERVGEGVRQSDISRLERNRVGLPRRHRMEELAAALDIPLGVLLSRSGWAGAQELDIADPERVARPVVAADEPDEPGRAESPPASDGEALPPSLAADDIDREDSRSLDDGREDDNATWYRNHSDSLRDTVARTESMIEQSRSRIRDSKSTMERGRRSIQRGQPADAN